MFINKTNTKRRLTFASCQKFREGWEKTEVGAPVLACELSESAQRLRPSLADWLLPKWNVFEQVHSSINCLVNLFEISHFSPEDSYG